VSRYNVQDDAQQKPQPGQQPAEIVAGSGKHHVVGVAKAVGEVVAVHAVVAFEAADNGFDGRAPRNCRRICSVMGRFWPAV
jgi:hypothetical protein